MIKGEIYRILTTQFHVNNYSGIPFGDIGSHSRLL